MGRETDSPIIGVDIGSFPVIAPDAEQVPLPEFGCQGIDIPGSPQDPSGGRDIPSPSSHSTTSEIPSDDSDKSVEFHPREPVVVRTPKGSGGTALLEQRRRQMLGAVEVSSFRDTEDRGVPSGTSPKPSGYSTQAPADRMEVDTASADDASDVSVLYDTADRAVLLATSRQSGSKAQDFPIAAATQRVKASLPPPLHQVLSAPPQLLHCMPRTLFLLRVVRTCIQS